MKAFTKTRYLIKLSVIATAIVAAFIGGANSTTAHERDFYRPSAASEQTMALETELLDAYREVGALNLRLGYFDDAIRNFSQVIELEPNNASAYLSRGQALLEAGRREQARADWEQAAQLYQKQGDLETYQEIQESLQQLEDDN